MPGESLPEAYVSFAGVLGDRLYAVHHAGAPKAFPFLTARSRKEMLRFRPESLDENPEILRYVAKNHDARAGVYAAVLVEGLVRPGDDIVVLD